MGVGWNSETTLSLYFQCLCKFKQAETNETASTALYETAEPARLARKAGVLTLIPIPSSTTNTTTSYQAVLPTQTQATSVDPPKWQGLWSSHAQADCQLAFHLTAPIGLASHESTQAGRSMKRKLETGDTISASRSIDRQKRARVDQKSCTITSEKVQDLMMAPTTTSQPAVLAMPRASPISYVAQPLYHHQVQQPSYSSTNYPPYSSDLPLVPSTVSYGFYHHLNQPPFPPQFLSHHSQPVLSGVSFFGDERGGVDDGYNHYQSIKQVKGHR